MLYEVITNIVNSVPQQQRFFGREMYEVTDVFKVVGITVYIIILLVMLLHQKTNFFYGA